MANFYDAMKNRLMALFRSARDPQEQQERTGPRPEDHSEMVRNEAPEMVPDPPEGAIAVQRRSFGQRWGAEQEAHRPRGPAPPADRTEREEFNISANRGRAQKHFERAAAVEEFKERLRRQREEERGRDRGRDNSR